MAEIGTPSNPEEIELSQLQDAVERAWKANKTPLILDRSKADCVSTFYSYQSDASILEAKKMGLDKAMKNVPVSDIMEEARQVLVKCLKYDRRLVVRLANSATDFVGCFNDAVAARDHGLEISSTRAYFPLELFEQGGKEISKTSGAWIEKLYRDEDKEHGLAIPRKACGTPFVILTSQFKKTQFDKFLWKDGYGLPSKDLFYCIWVAHDPEDVELL